MSSDSGSGSTLFVTGAVRWERGYGIIAIATSKCLLEMDKTPYFFGREFLTIAVFPRSIQNSKPGSQALVIFAYLGN